MSTKWVIDSTLSEIGFTKVIASVLLMFQESLMLLKRLSKMMKNFETSKIEFSTDVNSIDTNNDDRDNPLRVLISSILKIIKTFFYFHFCQKKKVNTKLQVI
jgi:polyisoprenoid-binding protein YceI